MNGKIDVIDPVLDEATRSANVIARVPNPGNRFRPGMSANVSAVLSERMNALTIPSEAVFAEGTQMFVYVVGPDSSVARTPVKLGTRLADVVEVVEGLKEGDRIVRAGHQRPDRMPSASRFACRTGVRMRDRYPLHRCRIAARSRSAITGASARANVFVRW